MKFKNKIILATLLILSIPSIVIATCLKDCGETKSSSGLNIVNDNSRSESTDARRNKSHNMGDVKNSIVGDVKINNGHKKLEFKNIGTKANIDASINSTIILGDTNETINN